jgi:dienelactone hydrolase
MVCFSAPVDPNTLPGAISIIPLSGGSAVSANQIIYDPTSQCAFARPSQILKQQTQYLLLVTPLIRDAGGLQVIADSAFVNCLNSSDSYCSALSSAVKNLVKPPASVIAASLFTTMSATAWLEKARTYVNQNPPPAATISTPFALSNLTKITWIPQDNTGTTTNQENVPLTALTGVASIAFGTYLSPDFLFLDGTIRTTPTFQPLGAPYTSIPVSFHVFQPASAKPKNGYPVVIYGHGLSDNQFGAPTYIASTLAKNGFATLAFEITGHGYGPGSVVNLTDTHGVVTTVPTPGRGVQVAPTIGPTDGCIVPGAIAVRDCGRQTAVDLFALVKTIQESPGLNLDPTRIYYVGQSFGGTYGTLFQAVEPNIQAAVLNAAGGTSVDIARLAVTARPLAIEYLASISPGLFNAAPPEYFNDDYVFRDIAPVVNTVPGAMAIQAAFEASDWLGMLGDPLSYAPHLQNTNRLANVTVRATLFQFGQGDLEVPNPTEFAVVNAAGAQSSAWFLLFAPAAAAHPELLGVTTPDVAPLPILPHRILANPTVFDVPAETSLALAEQQQVAAYFQSNGTLNSDPNQYVTAPFSPAQQLFHPLIPSSGTACDGIFYGVFSGDITIASGQECTFMSGGVMGNVTVNGGSLTLTGATVQGNVQVNGGANISIGLYTVINGNLVIQHMSAGGPMAQICGAKVQGDLQFQNNASGVEIGAASSCPGNVIGGNLQVQGNTASTIIFDNAVVGNLQDQSNTAGTQVFGNQVGNDLQCGNNSSITGGGNTAKQKQGQCANF